MAFQFKMPDIGEGIAEGEIVKIDIKVGDTIQKMIFYSKYKTTNL